MKKVFLAVTLVFACCILTAQNAVMSGQEMQKMIRQQFHQRDASKLYQRYSYPLSTMPKICALEEDGGLQLPQGAWFPGEWEEVQAIVVTCSYKYLVPGHENSYYWYADPLLPGYALYRYYDRGEWVEKGSGPYISVPDTVSDFGKVFFYVMDAIQSGNAEAWIRVEHAADSNVMRRQLERMNLRHDRLRFLVGGGNSFWFRDCGPICFYYGGQDSVAMLDFMYYPGRAMDDSLPTLIGKQMGIPNYITTIEWEGGNCIVDGAGMVISSDALYGNNDDEYGQLVWDGTDPNTIYYEAKKPISSQQVRDSLAHLIGSRATYVLPALKFDGGTGHVDLYADMLDENSFVFSKYPEYCKRWSDYKTANRNIETLTGYQSLFGNNFKHSFIPFPCDEKGADFASQSDYNDDYTRSYSNHTFVNNVIIQPCFSKVVNGMPSAEWDRQRIEKLKESYPGYTICPVDVSPFDGNGGAIHCITKQIPADNPVRILHPSITGNTDDTYTGRNVPVMAKVTNRSGMAGVTLFWRVSDGEWQQTQLSPGADSLFNGEIPLASVQYDGYAKVDYYLSATSNNGKTITKPMTAAQGGYYTFYLGHNPEAGVREAMEQKIGAFYPNPARQTASIALDLADGKPLSVRLVCRDGRMMSLPEATGKGDYRVDVRSLASGCYYVIFTSAEGRHVVRPLVVE
jgi:agmatine/peptidylarginine deiminase